MKQEKLLTLFECDRRARRCEWIGIKIEQFLPIKAISFDPLINDARSDRNSITGFKRYGKATAVTLPVINIFCDSSRRDRIDKATISRIVTDSTYRHFITDWQIYCAFDMATKVVAVDKICIRFYQTFGYA